MSNQIKIKSFACVAVLFLSSELSAQTISWSSTVNHSVPLSTSSMLVLAGLVLVLGMWALSRSQHYARSVYFFAVIVGGGLFAGLNFYGEPVFAVAPIATTITINSPSGTEHLAINGTTRVTNNYATDVRISAITPEACTITNNSCLLNTILSNAESCEITTSCVIPNAAPTISDLIINDDDSGRISIGTTLSTAYTYFDIDGDAEGITRFQWLRNGIAISGATLPGYVVVNDDMEQLISVEVIPVAVTGITEGVAVTASSLIATFPTNAVHINNTATIGGDGTLATPFHSFAECRAVINQPGNQGCGPLTDTHYIYVYGTSINYDTSDTDGDGTGDSTFNLDKHVEINIIGVDTGLGRPILTASGSVENIINMSSRPLAEVYIQEARLNGFTKIRLGKVIGLAFTGAGLRAIDISAFNYRQTILLRDNTFNNLDTAIRVVLQTWLTAEQTVIIENNVLDTGNIGVQIVSLTESGVPLPETIPVGGSPKGIQNVDLLNTQIQNFNRAVDIHTLPGGWIYEEFPSTQRGTMSFIQTVNIDGVTINNNIDGIYAEHTQHNTTVWQWDRTTGTIGFELWPRVTVPTQITAQIQNLTISNSSINNNKNGIVAIQNTLSGLYENSGSPESYLAETVSNQTVSLSNNTISNNTKNGVRILNNASQPLGAGCPNLPHLSRGAPILDFNLSSHIAAMRFIDSNYNYLTDPRLVWLRTTVAEQSLRIEGNHIENNGNRGLIITNEGQIYGEPTQQVLLGGNTINRNGNDGLRLLNQAEPSCSVSMAHPLPASSIQTVEHIAGTAADVILNNTNSDISIINDLDHGTATQSVDTDNMNFGVCTLAANTGANIGTRTQTVGAGCS